MAAYLNNSNKPLQRNKQWLLFSSLISLLLLNSLLLNAREAPQVVSPATLNKVKKDYGPLALNRLLAWQDLVNSSLSLSESQKLIQVNQFFNEVSYQSDQALWGKKDYWATPIELLAHDAGDCEDYVIAKYFTLKALGIPESKLYFNYVKYIPDDQAHMVLTYFKTPTSIPLVLDNINKKIWPASKRTDLKPIYSFNGDGLWLSKERGKGRQVKNGTQKLSEWNALLKKMNEI